MDLNATLQTSTYILFSKIYAAAGRWDDAQRVAEFLKITVAKEKSGCCHFEVLTIQGE